MSCKNKKLWVCLVTVLAFSASSVAVGSLVLPMDFNAFFEDASKAIVDTGFTQAIEDDEFWPWLILAIPTWTIALIMRIASEQTSTTSPIRELESKYKSLRRTLTHIQEWTVPVKHIQVRPFRGIIASGEPEYIDISQSGVRFDRELQIVRNDGTFSPMLSQINPELTCLRQTLNGSLVTLTTQNPYRLTAAGLPTSIDINLEEKMTGPLVKCVKPGAKSTGGMIGRKCSTELCEWVSVAVDEQVIVIKADAGRDKLPSSKGMLPYGKEQDQVRSFVSMAPIHLVNDHSVDQLRELVLSRHPEGAIDNFQVVPEQFKPTIRIDLPGDYREDNLMEIRIGPLLARLVGPCRRCSLVYQNIDNGLSVGQSEPLRTLQATRQTNTLPGCMFGTYYQCELLSDSKLYSEVLQETQGYPSFEEATKTNKIIHTSDGETFVRVQRGDPISVRLEEKPIWIRELKTQ